VNRPNVTNRKGLGLFALVAGAIVLYSDWVTPPPDMQPLMKLVQSLAP
jgi:hypothetical protein